MGEPGSGVVREMPRYKCHKEVYALKIKSILRDGKPATNADGLSSHPALLTPADEGYAPFEVPPDYVFKHEPKAGGYYVVYADGYVSYSPAQAFEEGHVRI